MLTTPWRMTRRGFSYDESKKLVRVVRVVILLEKNISEKNVEKMTTLENVTS